VLSYNASSVAVLALQIASDRLTGSELYDMASNLIRPMLVSVPGVAVPAPYGGTFSYVQVDLDQQKLLAHGLSAQDVSHALGQQNIVLPAGDQKIGALDFLVVTNASPMNVAAFNSLPIKQAGGTVVTVGDVATCTSAGPPQTNSVLVGGHQAATGLELREAIIEAANQIVIPTFVSTLCICIVWLPLFQLSGVAGYLFLPMAEAIVYAMLASFILSRTLVPTLAAYLLPAQVAARRADGEPKSGFGRFHASFERRFDEFRERYRDLLSRVIARRGLFIAGFLAAAIASVSLLVPWLGRDFFPGIKSGEIDMHFRAPIGLRLEEAGKVASLVDTALGTLLPGHVTKCHRQLRPADERHQPGVQRQFHNRAARLRCHHQPRRPGLAGRRVPRDTARQTAEALPRDDLHLPRRGYHSEPGAAHVAGLLASRLRAWGRADGIRHRRQRARDAVGVRPDGTTYWLDSKTGVSHLVNLQTPQTQLTSMNDLETIPIDKGDGDPGGQGAQILGAVSQITQVGRALEVSHRDIMPVIDIYASNAGRDLGAVNDAVNGVLQRTKGEVPHGAFVRVQGQGVTMKAAYQQLLVCLAFSILLAYLVIVVNFQSWLDPFIIITALPGALTGIVWSLFLTVTTLSVPALTGAIMCMGTATANSILVVSFARDELAAHGDPIRAAVAAGYARLRPVLMTALAMVIGMLPMSMSNTQNAPLGRAVIGGLVVATFATLLFVPSVFALLHRKRSTAGEVP
jgi:multidrug efflux pump subunit AcrB